jgi:hypothetical protein
MLDTLQSTSLESEREKQLQLNRLNALRLNPTLPSPDWEHGIHETTRLLIVEGQFLEASRKAVETRAAQAPSQPSKFIEWFEQLKENGPGQNDPLFPWLASQCSMDQMKWFLTQEVAGEAGFEDLTALTQLKLPTKQS